MHIGQKITEILAIRHVTKQDLGRAIGLTGSSATYLTTRPSIDVETLQKIGVVLKYNFFRHYPVVEQTEGVNLEGTAGTDIENKKLQEKISELEKQLESCKRDLVMQKQENGYLKKINELLEKTK